MSYENNQIAYAKGRPMCGLGAQIVPNESIESIIHKAGLDFSIDSQPVTYTHNDKEYVDHSKQMLIKSTDSDLLHIASNRFQIVQPETILNSFFKIVENLNFEMELIGQLDGGKKIFCRAKAPNGLVINGDEIRGYLTLATGNDGTMPTIANVGGTRLACMNQTPMLFKSKNNKHVTRHSTSFNPDKMMDDLGLLEYNDAWDSFEETINKLIHTRVSSEKAMETIHKVIGTGKPITQESTRTKNLVEQVYANMIKSAGSSLETTQGTAWGVFNAISYYTDHQMGTNDNNRAKGLLGNGAGNKIKNNALELLDMMEPEVSDQPNALDLLNMH